MIPKRAFACLTLASCFANLGLGMVSPAWAFTGSVSGNTSTVIDTKLSAMEVRMFAHAYKSDTDLARVARVERFVFGGTKDDGTVSERIERLSQLVKTDEAADVPYLPKKRAFADWTPSMSQTSMSQATMSQTQQSNQVATSTALAAPSYPRVTELENRLFAESFTYEPIVKRLDRLETREFGHTSRSSDLAVRVDTLVAYVVPAPPTMQSLRSIQSNQFNQANQANQYMQPRLRTVSYQPSYASANTATASDYHANFFGLFRSPEQASSVKMTQASTVVDQIEYLENATFGRTRPNKTLQKRVNALEEKFYGAAKVTSNKDLSARVSQLWSTVNNGASRTNPSRSGA